MKEKQIKQITDKAKQLCLIGIRSFDKDVQQFTCKFLNRDKCTCYNEYKKMLAQSVCKDCGKDDCLCGFGE